MLRNVYIGLVLLPSLGVAMAQDFVLRVVRPNPDRVLVSLSTEVTDCSSIPAHVVVPNKNYTSRELRLTCFENEKAELTLDLDQTSVEVLGELDGKSKAFLYVPNIPVGEKGKHDTFIPIPASMSIKVFRISDKRVILDKESMPPDYNWEDKVHWEVKQSERVFAVERVEPKDDLLILHLEQQPPNGVTLAIYYRKSEQEPFAAVASGTTQKAAEPSGTDATGNADLYAAFSYSNSNDTDDIFGVDFRGHLTFWSVGAWSISPTWTLIGTSGDQDDEDSLSISVEFARRYSLFLRNPDPVLEAVQVSLAPKFEAEKDFQNSNFLIEPMLAFEPPVMGFHGRKGSLKGIRWYVRPVVGAEAGWNLENAISDLEGEGLFRLKAGGRSELMFEFKQPNFDSITFDVEYWFRRLFRDETFVMDRRVDLPSGLLVPDMGEPVRVEGGFITRREFVQVFEGSRRYVKAAIRFRFNPTFEFTTSFTHGELPPIFRRVNKFELGFAYRFNSDAY